MTAGAGRYRHLPVVVEAMELREGNADEVAAWCGGEVIGGGEVLVPTIHGQVPARLRDRIVKGPHGEYWPVVPAVFASSYEAAPA